MPRTIVLLHGFAASGTGHSFKAAVLQSLYPHATILRPTIRYQDADWLDVLERVVLDAGEPVTLVGTSLGGFAAFLLAMKLDLPAVLVNPSLEPWENTRRLLGLQANRDNGEVLDWTHAHLQRLRQMRESVVVRPETCSRMMVLIGTQDSVVSPIQTQSILKEYGIPWLEFPDGHRFQESFAPAMHIVDVKNLFQKEAITI